MAGVEKGKPRTGGGTKRLPLKTDQLKRIVGLLHQIRGNESQEQALKDERIRTLLRILAAHSRPLAWASFTFGQLYALKLQILIFKCLKGRKPLPVKLVDAMESGLTVAKPKPKEKPTKDQNGAGQQDSMFLLPQDAKLLLRTPEFTAVKPVALDQATLLREREAILANRLEEEKKKPTPKNTLLHEADMDILKKQQALRRRLFEEQALAETEGRLGSRNREKSLRMLQREFDRIDKVRVKLLEQEETERRQAKAKWINALNNHMNAFRMHRESNRRHLRNINRGVLKHHDDVSRIADKADREAEKRRIQALRENDEEGYMELVRETKNARLMEVLNQTDSYLKELSKTLKKERLESGEAVDEDEIDDDGRKYIQIAHAKQENVTEQPALLEFGQLKEYQKQGLQWMVSLYNNRLNGILADEMGLGKTVQTIALVCHLIGEKANPGPYLIVVPLSTMSNWEAEFERWAPKLQVVTFTGDKKQRRLIYDNYLRKNTVNVCLVTFDYVLRGKSSLSQIQWQYIVIDEGHRIKNHASKLSVILGQQYQSRNRLLLTGTPLQNSLGELWALLNFLLPKVFKSCDTFETWFSAPFENMPNQEEAPKILSEEESLLIIRRLHQVLQPFLLRRLKSEVLKMGEQLPTKQEDILICDMSGWQQHTYDRIVRNEPFVFTNSQGRTFYDVLANPKMQLLKIVNHPYLFHQEYSMTVDDGPELWRASGKFDMLDACILKLLRTGHRILVFNQMAKIVDLQERLLRYRGIPFLRLDGSTKQEDRAALVKEYNSPETIYNVFLLTTKAGGLGVNLQTADTVIIFDSDWNPQADLQAADRAHRIGQKREVRIIRLITAKSVEGDVLDRATYKRGLEQKIIQAGMFDERSKDSERQARLRDLLREQDAMDADNEELPTPDEINQVLARGDHEIEEFKKIDDERKIEINNRPALMEEDEVASDLIHPDPSIMPKTKHFDMDNELEELGPRRAANRKVMYNTDRLSDAQYLKLLEDGGLGDDAAASEDGNALGKASADDTEAVPTKRKEADDRQSRKGPMKKARRISEDGDGDGSNATSSSSGEEDERTGMKMLVEDLPHGAGELKKTNSRKMKFSKPLSSTSGEVSEEESGAEAPKVLNGRVRFKLASKEYAPGKATNIEAGTKPRSGSGTDDVESDDAEDGEIEEGEVDEHDGDEEEVNLGETDAGDDEAVEDEVEGEDETEMGEDGREDETEMGEDGREDEDEVAEDGEIGDDDVDDEVDADEGALDADDVDVEMDPMDGDEDEKERTDEGQMEVEEAEGPLEEVGEEDLDSGEEIELEEVAEEAEDPLDEEQPILPMSLQNDDDNDEEPEMMGEEEIDDDNEEESEQLGAMPTLDNPQDDEDNSDQEERADDEEGADADEGADDEEGADADEGADDDEGDDESRAESVASEDKEE